MKNLPLRIVLAIIAMHMVIGYIFGYSLRPFDELTIFVFMIIPIIIILAICFAWLDKLWKNQETKPLSENSKATLKDAEFWIFMVLSVFCIRYIMYYTGQLLLPETEMSNKITFAGSRFGGNMFGLAVCGILYILLIWGVAKRLQRHWK